MWVLLYNPSPKPPLSKICQHQKMKKWQSWKIGAFFDFAYHILFPLVICITVVSEASSAHILEILGIFIVNQQCQSTSGSVCNRNRSGAGEMCTKANQALTKANLGLTKADAGLTKADTGLTKASPWQTDFTDSIFPSPCGSMNWTIVFGQHSLQRCCLNIYVYMCVSMKNMAHSIWYFFSINICLSKPWSR